MENNYKPATPKQIELLQKLGYQGNIEGLTSIEASVAIVELQRGNPAPTFQGNSQSQPTYQGQGYQQPQQYQQPQYQAPQQFNRNELAAADVLAITDDLASNLNELANDGMLFIPENYSVGNALKSAISKIMTSEQSAKLLACTEESKKQALTEYIVQGLDASKNQAYFIPYGDKMVMMRSYFGDVLVAKRTGLVKDVYAVVIYQGDEIEIGFDEYGRKTLIKHTTSFKNQDNDIEGAYAVAVGVNGYKAYEFMTRKELDNSWKMSKAPNGKLFTDYKQEAAKRTVIRRLVKMLFNSSLNTTEEQTALIGSYNRTTADEYSEKEYVETTVEDVKEKQEKKTASKKATPVETNEWPE